jgi:hypothetical protein
MSSLFSFVNGKLQQLASEAGSEMSSPSGTSGFVSTGQDTCGTVSFGICIAKHFAHIALKLSML